jgi:Tol biopolymer transport system component
MSRLDAGARVGQYEVSGLIGAGGMGEVYRARDPRLGRDVALKLLPEIYARHPEHLARFEREARLLAAISHANVAAIYGVEDAGGARALVLELVEGPTLEEVVASAARLGPLPLERVLDLARQIALGLEAAHEKSILHRDLKPGNVKLTPDGVVKVLDFGLGRLIEPSAADATITAGVTTAGMVIGTAAYMSPEQAGGEIADRRSDIWSFGCVVFEMLTLKRAFAADSISAIIARVLGSEPDWTLLPPGTPPALRRLLRRCLEKDPRRRLRDIGDARLELDEAAAEAAGGGGAPLTIRPDVRVERLTDAVGIAGSPALSPDGRMIAFVAIAGGRRHIWIRMIAGGGPLQITRDDADHDAPRWTPDSAGIVYYSPAADGASGHLWRISALGGTPRRLARSTGGADVSHDGRHLAFFHADRGAASLMTATLDGSNLETVLPLPPEYRYDCPRWSPDDREIAFQEAGWLFQARIDVARVSGAARRTVARDAWLRGHAWLPDGSGLVYSSSAGSTLAYPPTNNLRAVDRDGGRDRQLTFGDVSYLDPDLGGPGRLLASRVRSRSDIWSFPIDGRPADNVRDAIRVTRQTGQIQVPSMSPDGSRIAYISDSGGHSNLWICAADGADPRQITFERDAGVTVAVPAWAPAGDRLVFVRGCRGSVDLCAIGAEGESFATIVPEAFAPMWSADGRWIYFSRANLRLEKIDVATGAVVPVRADASSSSMARDGRTLFFVRVLGPTHARGDNEVCRADGDDGAAEALARIPASRVPLSPRLWVHPNLSPDERWLAAPLLDSTTANVWLIPAAGGDMRAVTDFGDRSVFIARWVSWSPDSRRIYAAVADVDADIVALEGLLP